MDESSTRPLLGVRATIYRRTEQDFSIGGISSRCKEVTLVGPGVEEVLEASDEAPAVRLVVRESGLSPRVLGPVSDDVARILAGMASSERIVHLEPVDAPGPMMAGGTYVAGDGRFNDAVRRALGADFYGAVALHDRYEG